MIIQLIFVISLITDSFITWRSIDTYYKPYVETKKSIKDTDALTQNQTLGYI